MKKYLSFLLSLLLLLGLTGCGGQNANLPSIKVITQNHIDQPEEPDYWQIRPSKKPKQTDAFAPDQATIYHVDCTQIDANVVNGKVQNQIEAICITDDTGTQIEDSTLSTIVETTAAAIDHSIFQFTIIEDSGYYFAFIKLNVNWSDPCKLYLYDIDNNTLRQLAHWDNVDFLGIQVDN